MAKGPVPTVADFLSVATISEAFQPGLPEAPVADATILRALSRWTDMFVSALGDRAIPPILSWSEDVERAVCLLAARDIMAYRGFNTTADKALLDLATEAEKYRQGIMDKREHPVFTDSHSGPVPDAPRVISSARADAWVCRTRGW